VKTLRLSRAVLGQLITLVLFFALCISVFSYLWVNSGGKIPFITRDTYRLAVDIPRVGNLVYFSDVAVAGVLVGKVVELSAQGDHAHVVVDLTSWGRVHQGAKVRVRAKTLVEESFLEIEDGTGPALPSGSMLPPGSGIGPTQLNDVLLALDGRTRGALADASKSLGAATVGTKQAFSDANAGLGTIGRSGRSALDALAAQSDDLRALSGNTATLLTALNTQRGEIAQLVDDANTLTTATSEGNEDLKQSIRELPPTLRAADKASHDLTRIGNALDPVARNLYEAAPDLNAALYQLRDISGQLRWLLPALDHVLEKGPTTFYRVPVFSYDVRDFIPKGEGVFTHLNPMLGYIAKYRREVANVLPGFGQAFAHGDANAKYLQSMLVLGNDQGLKAYPVNTQVGPLAKYNPYPFPEQGYHPSGQGGKYERLSPEPPH